LGANRKKDGKWTVYLDKDWKNVGDTSKVIFRRYTYFDHGANIYPMGPCGGKGYKLEGDTNSKILNGEYKWYNRDGKLSSVHVFQNGEYISCKEYFPTGELSQYFDYTKKCDGKQYGWIVYIYDKRGSITQTIRMCEDKDGRWPKMRG
jgi:antitoxin component YwqK of YwqJK toxin-antitoxin module